MKMLKPTYKNHSVIHATLRTEDIAQAIVDFLNAHQDKAGDNLVKQSGVANAYRRIQNGHNIFDSQVDQMDFFVWEILFDAMNEIAPRGYYFGSHVGDGSDFGFWEDSFEGEDEGDFGYWAGQKSDEDEY